MLLKNTPIPTYMFPLFTKFYYSFQIQLIWSKFKLQYPNDCDSNFVDVFPRETDLLSRIHNFCGSIADNVDSPDNILNIRFVADPKAFNSTFEAFYTAYRDKLRGDEKSE